LIVHKPAKDSAFQRFIARASGATDGLARSRRRAQNHCKLLREAYWNGEITFDRFCRTIKDVVFVAPAVQEADLFEMIGYEISLALQLEPLKRGRGNLGHPRFVREMSIPLVEGCKGNGTPISRIGRRYPSGTTSKTAFEWVADLWKDWGVTGVTPSVVEKWYAQKNYDEKAKTSD
jgi:hypothetical protein